VLLGGYSSRWRRVHLEKKGGGWVIRGRWLSLHQNGYHVRPLFVPVGFALVHPCRPQQLFLAKRRGQELQADRQPLLREAARKADGGDAAQVGADRVDVDRYIASGSSTRAPIGKAAVGEVGPRMTSQRAKALVEVVLDQAADAQGLDVSRRRRSRSRGRGCRA